MVSESQWVDRVTVFAMTPPFFIEPWMARIRHNVSTDNMPRQCGIPLGGGAVESRTISWQGRSFFTG